MKQALFYSLKVWLTSSLLTIAVTSFFYYAISYRSLDAFGATSWIPHIIAYYWQALELGFIIIWLIMPVVIQMVNRTCSTNLRKRVTIFLIAECVTTAWLVVLGLFKDYNYRHF
ncbi:MAG TPA: hypothetical protein VFE54_02725, partial [Mucilaginibacter sp.]|nr:hypothetical protein [Mucilaginibacter sp.]